MLARVYTGTDPHLIALGQIEADRATGKLSEQDYLRAKGELEEKHRKATRPRRIWLLVIVLVPLLFIGGCFALLSPADPAPAPRWT